jgi:hypothetical protein
VERQGVPQVVRVDPAGRRRGEADVLVELLEQNVQIDDDVIVLAEHEWAIHGYIAYDGEVIAATFTTEQEARAQLSHLDRVAREPR